MTTRLLYNGSTTISFMGLALEVHPGGTFSVPDDQAEAYLSREDIITAPEPEPVTAPPSTPSKAKKDTTSDPATPVS